MDGETEEGEAPDPETVRGSNRLILGPNGQQIVWSLIAIAAILVLIWISTRGPPR